MLDPEATLWTTEQCGEFLGLSPWTLIRWRRIRTIQQTLDELPDTTENSPVRADLTAQIEAVKGSLMQGPKFIRIGARKVRYRKSDVLAWAEEPI